MFAIPGGRFHMGSDRHYSEERPRRAREVAAFLMDQYPVTNGAFAAFVEATGYRTVAEIPPDPRNYPGADPAALRAGSIVFAPPSNPADMRFWGDWWRFIPGANWRFPDGTNPHPGPDHPVVHIAYADAAAYADWSNKVLPTEEAWEFAAQGGVAEAEFAWGAELTPGGNHRANVWQGRFPFENLQEDGFAGTSPVGSYPANAYGLHDMIGNVWEWTADWWSTPSEPGPRSCCASEDSDRRASGGAGSVIPRKVIKGGSHLCAPNYCQRYRPAARQPQAMDSGTTHIGFRCMKRLRAADPPAGYDMNLP